MAQETKDKGERWVVTYRSKPEPDFLDALIYEETSGNTIAYAEEKVARQIAALRNAAMSISANPMAVAEGMQGVVDALEALVRYHKEWEEAVPCLADALDALATITKPKEGELIRRNKEMTLKDYVAGMSREEAIKYFMAEKERLENQIRFIQLELEEVNKKLEELEEVSNGKG